MNNSTNIAIAMSDSIFRLGIAQYINSHDGFCLAMVREEVDLTFLQISKCDVNIIVVEINSRNVDNYESLIADLKQANTQLRILGVVGHCGEVAILKILRAGTDAILSRNCCINEVNRALLCLKNNLNYFPQFVDDVCKRQQGQSFLYLADVENRFISLCCSELTYKEIADRLHISVGATDKIREKLFKKFHVLSRTGLVMKALENGAVAIMAN